MTYTISRSVGQDFDCPAQSLFQALAETAAKYPEHNAIYFYNHTVTYQTLLAQVTKLSAYLYEKGVRSGDRIGIMLPNCPHYVVAFYAAARLGAIVVQVNPMYTPREVEYTLADSGAKALVVMDRLYAAFSKTDFVKALDSLVLVSLAPNADLEIPANGVAFQQALQEDLPIPALAVVDPAEDVAVLQYTGGTTGRSKGAMLTHRNLIANAWQSIDMLGGESISAEDKILAVIPLFHVYGMSVAMNMALFTGAGMILLPRFDVEEVLQAIKTHQPRLYPGVPTMYVAIANHPKAQEYGIDAIEICNSGSAPLPFEVKQLFESKTGGRIMEGYGLSEASPVTHSNRYNLPHKPNSIGPVANGTEAAIVDLGGSGEAVPVGQLGELIVKGPQVMKGYWNMPEETDATMRDGWLYTGDIARMDEDGYYYIVDRKKDMIISSGFNVYPRDIEEVLYQHPNVREAVVVGVPDEYRGESAKAFIVLKEQKEGIDYQQQIDTFCREHLAPYKVPRLYEFRAELPKTAVGKILRRALRDQVTK
ncbi:MAG: long-chain fatty acid--CoA ligase [Tumebacillaceae bacterium]